MKTKVYSIYISFAFLILSTITIFAVFFCPNFCSKSLILNIGYSIFGGSILAFAIYIAEYLAVKKKTVNDFFDESTTFLRAMNAIDFYDIDETKLIIAEYIYLKDYFELDYKAKEEFIARATNTFVKNGYRSYNEDILMTIYSGIDSFEKAITKSMMSYIEFSKYLTDRLTRLSGEIYFFSKRTRKTHKENIELCDIAIRAIKEASRPSMHFDLFLKKESSNIIEVTKLVKNLNGYMFRIDRNNNVTLVWKEKMNEFNSLLNQFICVVNRKKYNKLEYSPFISHIHY